ncbi:MAG: AroB-related putative sugar phosphate phospholyase (cyclizing) [Selenomonadaceae bacterium]|nr:AroB-related putative sugar phosphate phospholyase (cyclizing) [Selenomonadaceae bacterium]
MERRVEMDIHSRFKTYQASFVDSLVPLAALAQKPETFFVFDRKVYELYRQELPDFDESRLVLIDADEEKKNIDTALAICEKMTALPSKRNTHLISVGGGITQDITGFVATSLYRGIPWTFYPSTLLAACDSCIGGKSSLNYKGFKNLLGSFYPPDNICIYPQFFHTLSLRDYESGLGEVVKFNVIAGQEAFAGIERDIDAILAHDYSKLLTYVQTSLAFKKRFIEEDEFDRGIRVLLNFAHTFGHAYEVASHYAIPHGSAVAMGMITANAVSAQRGWLVAPVMRRIEAVCRKILTCVTIESSWFTMDTLLAAIHKDKKQTSKDITAVLMDAEGKLQVYHDLQEQEIQKAVQHMLTVLSNSGGC